MRSSPFLPKLTKSYALQWTRHSPKSGPSRGNICTLTHTWFPGSSESAFQTASRSVQPFLHISPQSVPILCNGPPFPLKIAPSQGRIDTVSQKRSHFERSVTLSSLNRFSQFLHCWKVYENCYNILKTMPTLN